MKLLNIGSNRGKMLYLLAKMNNAKRILEIGTGGGYSTIWLAKAITPQSGGKVITLEISPECAKVARSNIRNAGFHAEDVIVREGPALKTLELMHEAEQVDNFDFVFIDADKQNNVEYFRWALRFSHVGTLIVVDSIGRRGRLAETESSDETVLATRKLFEEIKREKRVDATAVQTVGSKGWDGFALLLVVE